MPSPDSSPRAALAGTIRLAADDVPEQFLLEALESIAERLQAHGAAVSLELKPSRLVVDLDVAADSADPVQAAPDALAAAQHVRAVVETVLGADYRCEVVAVTVQTPQQRDLDLERHRRERELVGLKEITDMRQEVRPGVVRQSVFRTTTRDDFPTPVASLAAGQVWELEEVVQFFARDDARRGTEPADVIERPAGTTPSLELRTSLSALLEEQPSLPDDLQQVVGRPHLLTGRVLVRAIELLGGARTVAGQLGVTPRTVQRWVAGAQEESLAGSAR